MQSKKKKIKAIHEQSRCFDCFDHGSQIRKAPKKNPVSRCWKHQDIGVSEFIKRCARRRDAARDSQSDERQKFKKAAELMGGCGFALAPEDGERGAVQGSEPGKSKGKKTFRCQRPETAASTFFFPPSAPKQRAKSVLEHLHNRNVEIFLKP